jgi:hypothetical protein
VCRSKHVEPSISFGIINSITKLHLVGISTESSTMHRSMNIKFWSVLMALASRVLSELLVCFVTFRTCVRHSDGGQEHDCLSPTFGLKALILYWKHSAGL